MHCTLSKFIIFVAGAAIGSLATWKYVKTKYERIANDEIAAMRSYVVSKTHNMSEGTETDAENTETSEPVEDQFGNTNNTKEKNGKNPYYMNYMDAIINSEEEEDDILVSREPYVIMPDQFSELADYDTISLTYYADGILADDMDEIIEDIDEVVGEDSLNHFGEFEDDVVYVRNEERKCDYEILRDNDRYEDVVGTNE